MTEPVRVGELLKGVLDSLGIEIPPHVLAAVPSADSASEDPLKD